LKGQPFEIIECSPLFKGRGHSVLPSKIKNLITGEIISWTFRPADVFEEPEISKIQLKFLYSHREKFFFCEKENPSKRFELKKEKIGRSVDFLKPGLILEGLFFEGRLINISLPIKVTLKVIQAPPVVKGQSAQAGTKPAILETGIKINVPLFVKEGDKIEVNTETREYVKRIS
jgi:elongation factor P